jgi:hypothetical protein
MFSFLFWFIFFISATIYLIPSIIAKALNKVHTNGIFLLNLLLGWTLIGFVISLFWAVIDPIDRSKKHSIIIKEKYEYEKHNE